MQPLLPPLLLLLLHHHSEGNPHPNPHPNPHNPHPPPSDYNPHPPPSDYLDYSARAQADAYQPGRGEFRVDSVECFDCHARMGTCNEGSCSGKACVKIEASINERKSVTKGCTQLLEEPSCVRTDMVGVEALRCVCAYDHCNADDELERAGLAEGTASRASTVGYGFPERPKRTQASKESRMGGLAPNYLVMLVFLSLFLTASFSLLIFNTVCVHLC